MRERLLPASGSSIVPLHPGSDVRHGHDPDSRRSRDDLLTVGLALFGASLCHNATGTPPRLRWSLCRLKETDRRTVAIEVGMQNGGMATGLAFEVLRSPQAAMASAFSVRGAR
jgi:hypothetical protein